MTRIGKLPLPKLPTPAGLAKEVLAELIAKHGWDAVEWAWRKVRTEKKAKPTGGAGAGVALLAVALLAGGKRRRRRR